MKIAYLVNTYPQPSHTFIRREILALERLGWQVHRFAMRGNRAALVDAADLAEDARTEHVLAVGALRLMAGAVGWLIGHPAGFLHGLSQAVRLGRAGRGGVPGTGGVLRHLIYLVEAAHVARRCRDLGIGHLHAHFGTNSATVALLAQAAGGPGFSFTVHGPEEFDAPLALSLGEKIARARFVVAISSFGRGQLFRWAALPDWPKIKVVHCGIETARFGDPAALPSGGPHLVAIGRLSEQKGFPILVESIAIAARHLPDLRLTICGDGPLRPQIEAEINRLGLNRAITLAGWVDEAGVRQALSKAQALILPSLAEGLPLVVIEAMASGRPVIASTINGIPELVTPAEGWLVPSGDPQALAEAILRLAETPSDKLADMGRFARTRALARHDSDGEAAKLSALFRDALDSTA